MPIIGITHSSRQVGPNPPTSVTAADVGTNRPWYNGAANVSFTAAATGAPATSYIATATASGSSFTFTSSSSPIQITGMPSQLSPYSFTVTAVNSQGSSTPSSPAATTNVTTVPTTVQTISATAGSAGSGSATVSFTAPVDNGGKAITLYTATSSPGGKTGTATTAGSITVTGLSSGVPYSFTITAANANGTGVSSIASNSVTVAAAPIIATPSFIIATPAQQNSISGISPNPAYAGQTVTVSGSFPKSLTNLTVGSTYVGYSQSSSSVTFTCPSLSNGGYSVTLYDGEIPVIATSLTITSAPIIATSISHIIATPISHIIATPVIIATSISHIIATSISHIIATPTFGGCWAVGSMVTKADGTRVAIETLNAGDEVMTANIPTYPNGEDSSNWFPSSVWSTDTVSNITKRTTKVVYNKQYTEPYYYLVNGQYKLTWEHWMFIERDGVWQFQQMANLKVGDKLVDESNTPVDITSIDIKQEPIEVSMLDVEPNDLFYAEGILTHNYRPALKT